MSRAAVLVIAASDSSGGAGLTRDVQTLSELQVPVRCALTAVTVQTDHEVRATHHVPPAIVRAQIRAALDTGGIGAIKIGMLGNAATVRAVLESLPPRAQVPIVLDPVLVSSSGGTLLDAEGMQLLCRLLLPRVTLLTPNLPEAASLLGEPPANGMDDATGAGITDEAALSAQLQRLLALGPEAVLIKGGHGSGDQVVDTLAARGRGLVRLAVPRVPVQRRGTGCILASAIAARLAAGSSLMEACRSAQSHVAEVLGRS
jgi:hydroxymethylpyrimidine/phosphomethylpyrimidine kinase